MFEEPTRDDGGDDGDRYEMFRMRYAILDGRTVVPVDDVMTWGTWFEKSDRHVAQTQFGGKRGALVSTVFLGMNMSHAPGGRPLWFETMIFRDLARMRDCFTARYATYDEAEIGHAMLEWMERQGLHAFVIDDAGDLVPARVWLIDDEGIARTSEGEVPLSRIYRNRRRVPFQVRTLRRHFKVLSHVL